MKIMVGRKMSRDDGEKEKFGQLRRKDVEGGKEESG